MVVASDVIGNETVGHKINYLSDVGSDVSDGEFVVCEVGGRENVDGDVGK